MMTQMTFHEEIENLMDTRHGAPLRACIQCGTCSGSCPAADFMDETPRRLIGLINADLKSEALAANTSWTCASCYQCTVRCPAGIDIAQVMTAVKHYAIRHGMQREDLVGPKFTAAFVRSIDRFGRSYEPVLAPTYMFTFAPRSFVEEALTATKLMMKGRIPVLPPRIRRLENFKAMIRRVSPSGEEP